MLNKVSDYYTQKIKAHGTTARGVDWNSSESQHLRFDQLLELIPDDTDKFSLLDYGCGYGALLEYIQNSFSHFEYTGLDISQEMLESARSKHKNTQAAWVNTIDAESGFDYIIASGIFNVKLATDTSTWEAYVFSTLEQINRMAKKGFAFNLLTSYSDKALQEERLYYASPERFFSHAKENFSRYVSLIHDYPLYEFSIVVTKAE